MKLNRTLILLLVLLVIPFASQAQGAISNNDALIILGSFVLVIAILVLIVSIIVLQVLKTIVRQEEEKKAALEGIELAPEPSFWDQFNKTTTDAVPIEKEETILLDHNYDGIQELDNHLPPWWKWLFYFTIAFSVVYLILYHMVGVLPLQGEEYKRQMVEAEAQKAEFLAENPAAAVDESAITVLDDAASLAAGKQVYDINCATCHRADGGGGIGPNLTDDYWLHGGSIQDIYNTIKVGVPAKGMISWEPILSPDQMQEVSSYIVSLHGTNPPDPKEPQGDLYSPDAAPQEAAPDSVQTVAENQVE